MKKTLTGIISVCFGLSTLMTGSLLAYDDDEKTNVMGQALWHSKTPEQVQKEETIEYNREAFESYLSEFGWVEYQKLSPEEKQFAMKIADKSEFSPDSAVFIVSKHY